jgi:hypothetical protein
MAEKILKRSEVRARLNVSKYRYSQLIAAGILADPLQLSEDTHPFHTESQVSAAERKLREMSEPRIKARRSKPLSDTLFQQIARSAAR